MYCKNSSFKKSITTHVVNYKDCIIVIKMSHVLNVINVEKNIIRMMWLKSWKKSLIRQRK